LSNLKTPHPGLPADLLLGQRWPGFFQFSVRSFQFTVDIVFFLMSDTKNCGLGGNRREKKLTDAELERGKRRGFWGWKGEGRALPWVYGFPYNLMFSMR